MLINEIFCSIQGEGPNIGKQAVFLRLGGCNLKCTWCDSKYTWNPEVSDNYTSDVSKILDQIREYSCKHLVITGGEPLLQQDEIKEIIEELDGYYVEIETNGSIPLKIEEKLSQINCSPKLSNSGNESYKLEINPYNEKVIFKFVVTNTESLNGINKYILDNNITPNKVWLMPEGVDRSKIIKKNKWLNLIAEKEGYNFSPRLHIMLYGNQRGI